MLDTIITIVWGVFNIACLLVLDYEIRKIFGIKTARGWFGRKK